MIDNENKCVTHHHACDCREAAHAAEVRCLQDGIRDVADQLDRDHWDHTTVWEDQLRALLDSKEEDK